MRCSPSFTKAPATVYTLTPPSIPRSPSQPSREVTRSYCVPAR
nr:MAG TPA: hypothetical protein [Caudoviricetes sp.]